MGGYIRDGGRAHSNQQPKQARKRRMTKSAESSQKDATKKLEKLYAQTLALRALRWKTAKGMAPIITRMLEDAKALVAHRGEAKGRYKVARDKIQSQPTSTNNHIETLMMEYRTFRFEAMDHRTVLAQVKAPAPEEVLSRQGAGGRVRPAASGGGAGGDGVEKEAWHCGRCGGRQQRAWRRS